MTLMKQKKDCISQSFFLFHLSFSEPMKMVSP